MSVTSLGPAPYAPAKAVLELVNRYRARGLPTPVSAEVLGRAGISDSLIPRTLQALKSLDLIDDDGGPTPTFEGLRSAAEADFKVRLAEWLNNAYADVLKFVDVETANETAIRDAFRNYKPFGQQDRMVLLFVGLYAAAGIGPGKTKPLRSAARTKGGNGKTAANNGNAAPKSASTKPENTDHVSPNKTAAPIKTVTPHTVYEVLLGIWMPGKMPKEVDDAVVTLMRWLKEQEHSQSS